MLFLLKFFEVFLPNLKFNLFYYIVVVFLFLLTIKTIKSMIMSLSLALALKKFKKLTVEHKLILH